MQATVSRKSGNSELLKAALLAAVLVAIAVVGLMAYALRTDSAEPVTSGGNTPARVQMPAWRFAEINMLPSAPAPTVQQEARWRFLERNELPIAAVTTLADYERQHFIEINQLPGDTDALVAPEILRGTRS